MNAEETILKLKTLSRFKKGWRFREGEEQSSLSINSAKKLLRELKFLGFENFDAFPNINGNVTLALYYKGRDFSVECKKDGIYELSSEQEEDNSIEIFNFYGLIEYLKLQKNKLDKTEKSEKEIFEIVIESLGERKGFSDWWDCIDEEIQEEIKEEIMEKLAQFSR